MNIQKNGILLHSHTAIERLHRHRWTAAGIGSLTLLGMMGALALAPSVDDNRVQLQTVLEQLTAPATTLTDSGSATFLREESIRHSDTLSSLAARLGISDPDALEFLRKDSQAQIIPRQLRPGKIVFAKTGVQGNLIQLFFPLNGNDVVAVVERQGNSFAVSQQILKLETQTVVKSGEIRSSLFGATDEEGIPDEVATQLAEVFAGDIDFHRDLRKGDRFSLVYETLNYNGQLIRSGRLLSAEFINDQKVFSAYWFQTEDGRGAYYAADGKSLRKAFLRSPLEFSRVTSGFSSARFHPVLQKSRAHRGVDYGAPKGTRVRAVADATVEFAGRQGGYGNLVILKHQSPYSTAYAHLNGFAAGIRQGARVSQGETIGYVGQTGLSSGPHLHYEFRVNAKQIDPLAVTTPIAIPLATSQVARFKTATEPLRAHLELAKQINLATIE